VFRRSRQENKNQKGGKFADAVDWMREIERKTVKLPEEIILYSTKFSGLNADMKCTKAGKFNRE
jgi:hypothetical protein